MKVGGKKLVRHGTKTNLSSQDKKTQRQYLTAVLLLRITKAKATQVSRWRRISVKIMKKLGLLLFVTMCSAVKVGQRRTEWNYRSEAEKVNLKGCANLTIVLDNWKFAIITQIKDLLLYDHHTVLPDYGRIKPLSEALDDLYMEFNALKERLAELTSKFDGIESFVDEVKAGQTLLPSRSAQLGWRLKEGHNARRQVLAYRRRAKPATINEED